MPLEPIRPARLLAGLLACAALAAGCTASKRAPAERAIAEVEAVLHEAGTLPAKYIPGELKDVQADLSTLKRDFEQGAFGAVVESAPSVVERARALAPAAAAREAELLETLREEWSGLDAALPAELAGVSERFGKATAGDRRPAGASAEDVSAARDRLRDALALWDRARQEAAAGRLPEAVTLAHQVRSMAEAVDAVAAPAPAATPVE